MLKTHTAHDNIEHSIVNKIFRTAMMVNRTIDFEADKTSSKFNHAAPVAYQLQLQVFAYPLRSALYHLL